MEAELVARARAGDSEAFESLIRRSARSMLQYADFVLHDLSAAEDAVQEAFVIAWRKRRTLKDDAAFKPWLRRIVLRQCLSWRRHPWVRVVRLTDRVLAAPDPDAVVQADVERAMRRLSPPMRAVVFLHFFEDMTLGALATELSIPESTAKTRLYEALRQLEKSLPGYRPASSSEEGS
jgi:RNA polymerase sigma-70 factor (ECF subfamily)